MDSQDGASHSEEEKKRKLSVHVQHRERKQDLKR